MRDAVPGTSFKFRSVLAERVTELVDPVPIRHRLTDNWSGQPQSRPGRPTGIGVFFGAGMPRRQPGHAQRQEYPNYGDANHQRANLQGFHHLFSTTMIYFFYFFSEKIEFIVLQLGQLNIIKKALEMRINKMTNMISAIIN